MKSYFTSLRFTSGFLLFLIIIFFLSFVEIGKCYSQWTWQQFNPAIYLNDIEFVNKNTGYVCGSNSTVAKTTDGGITWFGQYVGTYTGKYLFGISMLNENDGYIVGSFSTILKTSNGGNNWVVLRDGDENGNTFWDISFINENTGWIGGFIGNVQKTTNGGQTWDSITVNNGGFVFRTLQFLNTNTGYGCGSGGVRILKSTNGGNNWFFQYLSDSASSAESCLYFLNQDTGWVAESNTLRIYRTTNGGNYWQFMGIVPGEQYFEIYGIRFLNYNTGWVGGDLGSVYLTTNSGLNWINENANSPGYIANFSIYKDSLIWAAGGHGAIGHERIITGLRKIDKKIPSNFKLRQNYPNPFNSETTIEFEISRNDYYSLIIYDVLGREFEILLSEYIKTGNYRITFNASKLCSDTYFYKLFSNYFSETKKMLLIK